MHVDDMKAEREQRESTKETREDMQQRKSAASESQQEESCSEPSNNHIHLLAIGGACKLQSTTMG
jgi:hypothetical protein